MPRPCQKRLGTRKTDFRGAHSLKDSKDERDGRDEKESCESLGAIAKSIAHMVAIATGDFFGNIGRNFWQTLYPGKTGEFRSTFCISPLCPFPPFRPLSLCVFFGIPACSSAARRSAGRGKTLHPVPLLRGIGHGKPSSVFDCAERPIRVLPGKYHHQRHDQR